MRLSITPRHARSRVALAVLLLGIAGAAMAGPSVTRPAERAGNGPVRCELDVVRRGGSVELTALARSDTAARGEYSFRVSGRGTNIRQGGPFAIAPGGTERLGTVTLGAGGPGYDADLAITVGGRTIACADRIGAGGI